MSMWQPTVQSDMIIFSVVLTIFDPVSVIFEATWGVVEIGLSLKLNYHYILIKLSLSKSLIRTVPDPHAKDHWKLG